jgi:hypothetical protein
MMVVAATRACPAAAISPPLEGEGVETKPERFVRKSAAFQKWNITSG